MKDLYTFELDKRDFDNIKNGKKTIHLTIECQNERNFLVGNKITFILKNNEKQNSVSLFYAKTEEELKGFNTNAEFIIANIINLYYFPNVVEAVETLGNTKCGYKKNYTPEKVSDLFLKNEKIDSLETYEIVAIEFEVLENFSK